MERAKLLHYETVVIVWNLVQYAYDGCGCNMGQVYYTYNEKFRWN